MKLMINVRPSVMDRLHEVSRTEHRTPREQLEFIVHKALIAPEEEGEESQRIEGGVKA